MARTALQVAELLQQRLADLDMSGFSDLFAQDALFEYPFGFPGAPPELRGRAAIREHLLESRTSVRDRIEVTGVESTLHETVDPDVAIIETVVSGVAKATGNAFRFPSGVGVVYTRDGEVVRYRDYSNVVGAAAATGLDLTQVHA